VWRDPAERVVCAVSHPTSVYPLASMAYAG
jgi:hypothetical protein